ncbi:MAG: DUF4339 domain-containing protein [Simkaniaceae bacterium]|nr:DUF4339 domain-containing protein [Candidatus Sacchlamyda saccharinae]
MPSPLLYIAFGALSAYFARKRGKDPFLWFFLGMLFGVFGLLFLFFDPKAKRAKKGPKSQDPNTIDILPAFDPKHNEKFWYYLDGQNRQHGPMSFDAIYRLYKEATLSQQSFVWNESLESWQPLKDFITKKL